MKNIKKLFGLLFAFVIALVQVNAAEMVQLLSIKL